METKVCKICLKEISNQDDYIRITDYKEGKFFLEGFYHNQCYQNKIKSAITMNLNHLKSTLPVMMKDIIQRAKGVPV